MHALAELRPTPDRVSGMTQQRSGGWWPALDGSRGADKDEAVIPRQGPRHGAASSTANHEDTLVRMLYEEHAGPLLMFVLRLTGGDRQRAEDIVQETLLAIHAKRHTWAVEAAVLPWVYAIARYKLIDAFRRRGRHIEVELEDVVETLAQP